ncbi:hypothetical protein C8R44DRAFT_875373 [Mycena epipterygia]|nr:hypothetical protein C8R44DRAFT_875373 [Mycena epipterygia]
MSEAQRDNTQTKGITKAKVADTRFKLRHVPSLMPPVTFCGHVENAVCALLEESPHIVPYIRRLKIELPSPFRTLSQYQSLQPILAKLTNVWRCAIDGGTFGVRWTYLPPDISSALVDFVARQTLISLRLRTFEDIPQSVFLRLITSASRLAIQFVNINRGLEGGGTHFPILPPAFIFYRFFAPRFKIRQ